MKNLKGTIVTLMRNFAVLSPAKNYCMKVVSDGTETTARLFLDLYTRHATHNVGRNPLYDLAAAPFFLSTSLQVFLKLAAILAATCCAFLVFKTSFTQAMYWTFVRQAFFRL